MRDNRKPRIGFLGIMHGLYDEKQPEITQAQEAWAREVASSLSDLAEIDFPKAAKSRKEIEGIVREFNYRQYDGILVVMLLYSPSLRLVQALEENRLPLLLANIQPLPGCHERLGLAQADDEPGHSRDSGHRKHGTSGGD